MASAALTLGKVGGNGLVSAARRPASAQLLEPEYSLVTECLKGDEAAWEQLVRLHTRHVYALCYRFTGSASEAQDLTQEVFLRVFRTLKSFRSAEGSFGTWLARVTRNLLIDSQKLSLAASVFSPGSSRCSGIDSLRSWATESPTDPRLLAPACTWVRNDRL